MSLHILEHGSPVVAAAGGIDYGFNFRATENIVTDGANEAWVGSSLVGFNYPSTAINDQFAADVQAGWTAGGDLVDDDPGGVPDGERRLAGYGRILNNSAIDFRLDVAGTFMLTLGGGRTGTHNTRIRVYDDAALQLDVQTPMGTNNDNFWLAADDNRYSAAQWTIASDPPGAARVQISIAQFMIFRLGEHPEGANNSRLNHIRVEEI